MTNQKALIAKSPIGVFAFSEKGDLLFFKLYSKNPSKAVEQIGQTDEEFLHNLKDYETQEGGYDFLRKNIRDLAISLDFSHDEIELNNFLNVFGILYSRNRMKGSIERDKLVIQASNSLDDLNKMINLMDERLYEWFSLHYPEMRNRKELAENVIKFGRREKFPDFKQSFGVDLTEEDENILKSYANSLKMMRDQKKEMEKYLKETVSEVAKNFSSLLDPLLAAKILSMAGSLEKLAKMPASTIQLLGAEKALFRHLHQRGKSPKFGIIFNSSYIQNAPESQKGKAARVLSSKLMQASRIDYYSGRDESQRLKKELEDEMQNIGVNQ